MGQLRKYVRAEDLAAAWDVSPKSIYGWASRKQNPLPRIKIGRVVRFDPAEAQAWLDQQQRAPDDE